MPNWRDTHGMMRKKSNEPTKSKKAMKTIKYLSMAALALVGAVMTGCSSDDNIIDEPQQPANKDNIVTLTTTVSLDGAETRALSADGTKTFAEGDQMAVIYKNTSGQTQKAVSEAISISPAGSSATFTVTLTNPNKDAAIRYIYPAAMAKSSVATNATIDDAGTVDFTKLNSQDGTLNTLGSNYDLCTFDKANWGGEDLPIGTLTNQLAILAIKLKNDAGGSDITSSITSLTLSDGTNSYAVSGHDADGHIYVAIRPTTAATIELTATAGSKTYVKVLSSKSYAASNGYPLIWKMAEVIKGKFSVSSTKQVYFSPANLQATTSNGGSTWTWHFGPNQYARVGNGVANTAITGNGTVSSAGNGGNIDLFGWSTSTTHLGISNNTDNSKYSGNFVDWGLAPEVTACIGTGWRTLTGNEWIYLMDTRDGNRYAKASINGTRDGFIILPDGWTNISPHTLKNYNSATAAFTDNNIPATDWTNKYEKYGAVFLPVTGQRSGTTINGYDTELHYWSSTSGANTSGTSANANHLRYNTSGLVTNTGAGRCNGFAVRLGRDVK